MLAADGAFLPDGRFVPLAAVPGSLLAEGFRRAVLEFLVNNDALSERLRNCLLGWRQDDLRRGHGHDDLPLEDASRVEAELPSDAGCAVAGAAVQALSRSPRTSRSLPRRVLEPGTRRAGKGSIAARRCRILRYVATFEGQYFRTTYVVVFWWYLKGRYLCQKPWSDFHHSRSLQ